MIPSAVALKEITRSAIVTVMLLSADCAPDRPQPSAFVVRLGADTIMVERYTKSGNTIEGDIIDRSPTTTLTHYSFVVDSGGNITRIDTEQSAPPSTPNWRVSVQRASGGFDVVVRDGDSTHKKFVAGPPDAIPLTARSIAQYEVATARLRRANAESLVVAILDPGAFEITPRVLRRIGADSVSIPLIFPRGERARVDAAGRVLGVSGAATSYKWLSERRDDVDIATLTRSFAKRDSMGQAFGAYSTRDTTRAMIDGAEVKIEYGRPAKRGRAIFGNLVPWGEVWRTGADEATKLTTTRELQLGSLRIPAGSYSLYTLPTPTAWKLIVNRQTGQNGLQYDPSQDLGRAEMVISSAPRIVERLTIAVEAAPSGGALLTIAWDNVIAELPFKVLR